MFFIRMRVRTPWKCSLQSRASGTPITVTSSRRVSEARGQVLSYEVAARDHFRQVTRIGLGIERHHDVHIAVPSAMPVAGDADLVPGGQSLDVGREVVLAHHGHA